jgi:hypothetical protein
VPDRNGVEGLPINVGNIKPHDHASVAVPIDFSKCSEDARFNVSIVFSSDNGEIVGDINLRDPDAVFHLGVPFDMRETIAMLRTPSTSAWTELTCVPKVRFGLELRFERLRISEQLCASALRVRWTVRCVSLRLAASSLAAPSTR